MRWEVHDTGISSTLALELMVLLALKLQGYLLLGINQSSKIKWKQIMSGHIIHHLSGVIFTPTYDLSVTHWTGVIPEGKF